MTEAIIYLLKVLMIQGVLFLFYRLFLKNSLRHQLNRLFLLSSLCLAFIIPFIELPTAESIPIVSQNDLVITWLSEPVVDYEVVMAPIINNESDTSYWFIIPVIYVGITVFFLVRSIVSLAIIQRLKAHSIAIKNYWFKLFKTSHSRPFSFFSNVFIPESLFDSDDFDQVLAHECVHVKQRHSLDRLLLDFVVSLFWFNPFMYLYRNALIEIHEYQADEAVVNRFKDPIRYQEILFSQLQTPQYSGMVSHFNFSLIKKRIVMMNKQNKKSRWIYLLVAPLTLAMIFAFSGKETMKPIENVGNGIANIIGPINDFSLPEINWDQQDYIPSISPLKKTDLVRLTSGFGMRTHPVYKVKKMHLGVDFSCEIGSEVVATADGVVDEIKSSTSGYGKMISISHGDEYQTRYAQLSAFNVKKGDKVKKGQLIGLSGNSGASTAPHLHYEVIENGVGQVDPKPFIDNYKFKPQIREIVVPDNSQKKKQNELAEKEMLLAKEEAERAQIEKIRAEEMRNEASEEQQKAYQLQREAEERRQIEEKVAKEELLFEDEKQQRKLEISGIEGNPLFIIDGVVQGNRSEQLEIGPDQIETIKVIKNQAAIDKYGDDGKNGVIEITSKSKRKNRGKDEDKRYNEEMMNSGFISFYGSKQSSYIESIANPSTFYPTEDALFLVDGIEKSRNEVASELNIEDIKSIKVISSPISKESFEERAENNVVEITTKKARKVKKQE